MTSWQPIHNPYIVGNPIKGAKLFFGREDDFTFIKTKFAGGKEGGLIVLCGARRSGKTSILFQILDGRLGDDFLPVLIDMQSMAIVNDRQFVRRLLELVETAAAAAGVAPGSAEFTDSPFADVEAYVARLERALGDRKLILAFDEYELIETGIDSGAIGTQVLRTLANLIEHHHVFVVFTGSEKLEERSKKYWDIFLSKALHRRISFLSHDDTWRLIREPVAGVVDYAEGVPERIYELTAGQPFYTQVICQSLVDHLNDVHRRRVELEDVDRAVEEVIQNPLPQMIFHWNALGDLQKLTLAIMAELTRKGRRAVSAAEILAFARDEKLGYRIDPNALNKTLDQLFHGDLVRKDAESGAFGFKMDLWRLWSIRMHSVWQVIGEIDQSGRAGIAEGITRLAPARSNRKFVAYVAGTAILLTAAAFVAKQTRSPHAPATGMNSGGENPQLAHMGQLVVKTTPPGAEVFVNGASGGRSPLDQKLPATSYTLHIELKGYRSVERRVVVREHDTTAIDMVLTALVGRISVETQPTGARVTLDNGAPRTSPAMWTDVSADRAHHIAVSLDGYDPDTYDAQAIADSTVRIVHVFSRRTAPLAISSNPAGAAVTIDERNVGATPFATTGVSYGPHSIRLSLDGYVEWSGEVEVPVDKNLVDITLTRLAPGTVVFSVTPYGDVYVDGKRIAQAVTYFQSNLEAGTHTVEFRNPQFKTFSREIVLESGATQHVEHTFTESGP